MNDSQADLKALLALCQAELRGGQPGQGPVFPASNEEWHGVLRSAESHGLVGLLYRIAANRNNISPTAIQAIRSAACRQTARSCYLTSELLEILTAFQDLQIEALALKGPALAVRTYGHLSAREFCDLDILVHRADLDRAAIILLQRGYRSDPGNSTLREFNPQGRIHDIFVRDDGARVELHWKLNSDFERSPIEGTGIWSRLETVPVSDRPVPTLGMEDTLLFLCVHGFKHRWCRLKWVTDIAYTIRYAGQIDWDALVLRSRQTGCHRMLLSGLGLASGLLGSVIPPAIEKLIRLDPVTVSLIDQIQSALLSAAPIESAQELIYWLRARERFRDHLVLVCRLLPRIFRLTPEDGLPNRNPPRNKLAAVFKRPVRLYKTFGLSWMKPVFRFR